MPGSEKRVLLGNEAIARGIVESGCHFMASYPGTPSSEILPGVVLFSRENNLDTYIEWSTNEKVAFENALAASYTGKRAAVAMKQVGLNVATDPLMSSAYIGTMGGFVIISCDDPGPHSSQTEQDTRFMAMFAKIPVFDPASPRDAHEMMPLAFELSEKFQIPVLFRPVTRVSHARQTIRFRSISRLERRAHFQRNPQRWSATPRFRFFLHRQLNLKLREIAGEFASMGSVNFVEHGREDAPLGIIAGGICHAMVRDILREMYLQEEIPLLKIGTPYPLPTGTVEAFISHCRNVLILEETEPVIELQILDKSKLRGRLDGTVPAEGEMTPDTVSRILSDLCRGLSIPLPDRPSPGELEQIIGDLGLPLRRPSLCPGCPHRASFYSLKRALPEAIFTSDIGCYTLGMNMDAVDTCHDMGASITFASGLYHAYNQDGLDPPIIATIGDSTFYHSGTQGLLNAVYNGSRFILVVLDNSTTAMTGMQPTPESGLTADGHPGTALSLEELVKGAGVKYVRLVNPYDMKDLVRETRRARRYTKQPDGGVAVLIARYPCITHQPEQLKIRPIKVDIRHLPPPDKDIHPVAGGAVPEALLPVHRDKPAPCTAACPLQVDARGYIALISKGRFDEALALVREKNPFPGITGRLCARPCEKICRRRAVDQPIAIDLLKRFLADREGAAAPRFRPGPKRNEKVAIVGSGPAGLMAAFDLRREGYGVTIFEALPVAGGTMAVGTGRFRLPQGVLDREIEIVRNLGAEIRLNTPVGDGVALKDLRTRGYEAVLLALGAHRADGPGLPGSEAEGVIDSLAFLKRVALKETAPVGSRVVVIGGTDRALDAARTALRLGAREVTILYNRSRRELPAQESEIIQAEKEGVRFRFLSVPTRIATSGGRARGVSFKTAVLGKPTSLGRTRIVSTRGAERTLRADLVITSPAYVPDLSGLEETVALTSWKTIHVDPVTLATTAEGIFAAGDGVTGPKNLIDALAGGRKAALSIVRYLRGEDMAKGREMEGRRMKFASARIDQVEKGRRIEEPTLAVEARAGNFQEVLLLPGEEAIIEEARRCLHCGACFHCDTCLIQCPEQAISKTEEGYTVDYDKCTACRVCFLECPTSAIDMPAVGACVGCGYCLKRFECPSLVLGREGQVEIDRSTCVDCGLCIEVCGQEAIVPIG
ncbi:MAG: FAD-dependent oxidoreductase [Deltaproteobacteria bacterium]|nr:FAD-dependent oxidoreductase [Deltaproteobacteria bacterium]MBW2122051.1 FAD-dependent oxidoreductase [Deltaproteobacteria bacterium]